MRTLVILLTLLAIRAEAAERTWTIARDVYTAEAELIAVRGDLVYLRIDGRVEEVPLARLSANDQDYIASLSLAPITPGPAAEAANYSEEMPLPGEPDPMPVDSEMKAPDLAPAYGGGPIQQPAPPQRAYRMNPYGGALPPQPGMPANYYAPQGNWGENAASIDRRYRRPPTQGPANQADRRRGDEADEGPGILGFRARRMERERAAAANRGR